MDNSERAFWVTAGYRAAEAHEPRQYAENYLDGTCMVHERRAWLEGYDGYIAHFRVISHSQPKEENKKMDTDQESNWGIVELMGRKVVAGLITKSEMIGPPMLRIDVPETKTFGPFTCFYGGTAIYGVTFTSEEVARKTAESVQVNPVSVYVPELVSKEKYDELHRVAEELEIKLIQAQRMLPAGTKIEVPQSPSHSNDWTETSIGEENPGDSSGEGDPRGDFVEDDRASEE
jgi:hypothetical protein